MTPAQVQSLYDSAIRSHFGWKHKALQHYRVGLRTLISADEAREGARNILDSGSHALSVEEMQVFDDYTLYDVEFFLIALAIENLLKAIWTGRHHSKISSISNMRKDLPGLANHNLTGLAKDAGLSLSHDEIELLDALTNCILWYGRYSTPIRKGEYETYLGSGGPTNRFLKGSDIFTMDLPIPQEIGQLFSRLAEEIKLTPEQHSH